MADDAGQKAVRELAKEGGLLQTVPSVLDVLISDPVFSGARRNDVAWNGYNHWGGEQSGTIRNNKGNQSHASIRVDKDDLSNI